MTTNVHLDSHPEHDKLCYVMLNDDVVFVYVMSKGNMFDGIYAVY